VVKIDEKRNHESESTRKESLVKVQIEEKSDE